MRITYIGGPTALLEIGGLRLLTDPTFDPAGSEYPGPGYTLQKTRDPAIGIGDLGRVDAVLLSHDHHADNLDRAGRSLLGTIPVVLTTEAGAARLGAPVIGLRPWDVHELPMSDGTTLRITATPARHGPVDGDRGPVIGFVLEHASWLNGAVYVSGDTVLYEALNQVAQRFKVSVAVLFMGAARVAAAGPAPLTFTAAESLEFAALFPDATIVPLHFEGWRHFTESHRDISAAFADAGLSARLHWLPPGRPEVLTGHGVDPASPAARPRNLPAPNPPET
jgi:L-ascorbate metabolism protein UlaG (beta-lactamase superfamily)